MGKYLSLKDYIEGIGIGILVGGAAYLWSHWGFDEGSHASRTENHIKIPTYNIDSLPTKEWSILPSSLEMRVIDDNRDGIYETILKNKDKKYLMKYGKEAERVKLIPYHLKPYTDTITRVDTTKQVKGRYKIIEEK